MLYSMEHDLGCETVSLWHKDHDLQGVDLVVLPGGFSYGDYLRSGAIARFSPIMEEVVKHANNGGFVFGVCNGFQVLTESHLLPGALLHNESHKFICKNVYLKPASLNSPMTADLDMNRAYKIPIAHGEGRFQADEDTLQQLNDYGQVMFQYCDADGNVTPEANPNGSIQNIAGICSENRNVMGMMPHPERASTQELLNDDGKLLLSSMIKNMAEFAM